MVNWSRCGRSVAAVTLAAALSACGDSGTSPGGGGGGGGNAAYENSASNPGGNTGTCSVQVGALGCPKGLVLARLDGQTFNGGVVNGGALYTPIAAIPSLNLPAQDFIVIVGIASNGSQLTITTRAKTGQSSVGLNVIDPETRGVSVNSLIYITPGTGVGAGWAANVSGGSGTITVDAVSTTAARGTYSVTMAPVSGTPATGNRTLTGTFNVTF